MRKKIIFLTLLFLAWLPLGSADDNSSNKDQGVKVNGVIFDMANDRRVETVGGIAQPEDMSKYVQRKIDGVNAQISSLQSKVDHMEEQMDNMLELLKNIRGSAPKPQTDESSKEEKSNQGGLY